LRVGGRVLQWRAEPPGPGHTVLVPEPQQRVELLGVEVVELGDVLAEQREWFGERAAAGDDLGPAVADQVEGGEILIHPYRVQDTQHSCGGRERDTAGRPSDRGVHDRERGDCERAGVVLTIPNTSRPDCSARMP
jgi:hypothetical protein